MAQKKVFDFGAVFTFDKEAVSYNSEAHQKAEQVMEMMRLIDMGVMDRTAITVIGENPWLYETKKFEPRTLEKPPVEKIESPPGKRKIIL